MTEQQWSFASSESGATTIQAATQSGRGIPDDWKRSLATRTEVRRGDASECYQAAQLRSVALLALLWRHRDNARLQHLLDNLWLSRRRVRSHITPGGLAHGPIGREEVPRGDRWDNEIPALFCSHLTSHAVWPSDEICELLERNAALFRDEFGGIDPKLYQVDTRDKRSGLTDGRNWTVFPFYDGLGKLQVDNARRCPRIAEFLGSLAGTGRIGCMAFFSIMNPKTHVPRHTSQLNTRMRYHLGIEVPERDVHFRIHDQLIAWKQDRCIKIDDSYEHEVFQQSDRRRVVFILDLPHPELLPEELEFLEQIMRCSIDGSALDGIFETAGSFER
ncbi:aspartyl/asparaginyl beta-hydroxylase domain-containing protein [Mycobacterium sp. SM1]|uniref:aspartyl/asparaginyl beta-hydroxylase domain-containing protein n=1 Tax=Mycobacterium sp. SM1 TaxID=2816243 RepID=UPI001BCFE758|nr:aspartyl/asparaginyl beta-hydroxylase domain-containing protein [Mycobacterium sp. SM1]MBS4728309.1 aspartyl/asparaginyl beta-hydroxylase domain-containing protein [Mycobacterium sp. SM1]